jgi:hypothetical protein
MPTYRRKAGWLTIANQKRYVSLGGFKWSSQHLNGEESRWDTEGSSVASCGTSFDEVDWTAMAGRGVVA